MRHSPIVLALLLALASPVAAQDFLQPLQDLVEDLSPRRPAPKPAPKVEPAEAASETKADDGVTEDAPPPIPRPRPAGLGTEAEAPPPPAEPPDEPEATPAAAEPEMAEPVAPAEPAAERVYQTACPALLSGLVVGKMLPPIAEGICGERSPLELDAVSANGRTIPLSSPVTTNCEMAGALAEWTADVDAYSRAAMDSPIAELTTGTSYMCRDRVGGDEGFTSEHGFANAIDLVGFTLENGESISVKDQWQPATAPEGKLLRQSHGAACGIFTTVLGPEANADHEDHLHLDLGCHGQTCTAQICE
ncbi:extensin family protein [Devosia soli]|uniref:extensin-like domain-containing protein n=1 Tax=Devosia soli TaxID=361041 RepID=UPI00069B90BC|nr:extensin family protein [Devosia soli]